MYHLYITASDIIRSLYALYRELVYYTILMMIAVIVVFRLYVLFGMLRRRRVVWTIKKSLVLFLAVGDVLFLMYTLVKEAVTEDICLTSHARALLGNEDVFYVVLHLVYGTALVLLGIDLAARCIHTEICYGWHHHRADTPKTGAPFKSHGTGPMILVTLAFLEILMLFAGGVNYFSFPYYCVMYPAFIAFLIALFVRAIIVTPPAWPTTTTHTDQLQINDSSSLLSSNDCARPSFIKANSSAVRDAPKLSWVSGRYENSSTFEEGQKGAEARRNPADDTKNLGQRSSCTNSELPILLLQNLVLRDRQQVLSIPVLHRSAQPSSLESRIQTLQKTDPKSQSAKTEPKILCVPKSAAMRKICQYPPSFLHTSSERSNYTAQLLRFVITPLFHWEESLQQVFYPQAARQQNSPPPESPQDPSQRSSDSSGESLAELGLTHTKTSPVLQLCQHKIKIDIAVRERTAFFSTALIYFLFASAVLICGRMTLPVRYFYWIMTVRCIFLPIICTIKTDTPVSG